MSLSPSGWTLPRKLVVALTRLLLPCAFCFLCGHALAAATSGERPNIIFILVDDMGYGDLGCYGQQRIKTPHLDRMATEGIRFTECYAGAAMCRPSRFSLMTGLHTGHAGARANGPMVELKAQDVTVGKILQQAGYRTAVIGKWALGDAGRTGLPTQHGFEEWFGFPTQTSCWECYPESLIHNGQKVALEKNQGGKTGQFADDLFTERALDYVQNHQRDPFFLFLAYITPHANSIRGQKGIFAPTTAPYSNESWPEHEKNFAAMITRLDANIGRLLARLKELRLDEKTIVFFSSDNGPHNAGGHSEKFFNSAGPLRGLKFTPFEGGVRVPMIVRWPGRIQPAVSDRVWSQCDFMPTAAELAGTPAPAAIDGASFLPFLLGKPQRPTDFLYWEFHAANGGFEGQAARMGHWKAVRPWFGGPVELYDLRSDLAESRNVAGAQPETVKAFEARMKAAHVESAVWPVSEASGGPNSGKKKKQSKKARAPE